MSLKTVASILVAVDGGWAEPVDVRARADQEVILYAALEQYEKRSCVLYTLAPKVKTRCRVEAPQGEARWFKVEADAGAYNNVPGGKFELASIGWVQTEWAEGWRVPADVEPLVRQGIKGAGTMRYRLELKVADATFATASLSTSPGGPGARQDLRKVTLRRDDSYLGYLSELGGLPYVFGSTAIGREPHQAERGVGVDCADLMIYGLKRLGRDEVYRSSRTLGPISRLVAKVELKDGRYVKSDGTPLSVGADGVLPGDWLVFDGHVGAFAADRGELGVFDHDDWMIHTAWREPAEESLRVSGYGRGALRVLRPKALEATASRRAALPGSVKGAFATSANVKTDDSGP